MMGFRRFVQYCKNCGVEVWVYAHANPCYWICACGKQNRCDALHEAPWFLSKDAERKLTAGPPDQRPFSIFPSQAEKFRAEIAAARSWVSEGVVEQR